MVDDEFTRVYVMPEAPAPRFLPTTISLGGNWHEREGDGEGGWRWAQSPASLNLASPRRQEAILEITPVYIHAPAHSQMVGQSGQLRIAHDGRVLTTMSISVGETAQIPLILVPGVQTVTLTLEAGNFRPGDAGHGDQRSLSFAVRHLNLRTGD
jgi:hypothetical protein